MKAKRKINYGFIFSICCCLFVLAAFGMMNYRMGLDKKQLVQDSERYQTLTLDALEIEAADSQKVLDPELGLPDLEALADEIAEKQWQKVADRMRPFFADESTFNRHGKVLQDVIKESVKNQFMVASYKIQDKDPAVFKWNMLKKATVSCSLNVLFDFSNRDTAAGLSSQDYRYLSGPVYWQKTAGSWKIYKAGPIFPDELVQAGYYNYKFSNYYKNYNR